MATLLWSQVVAYSRAASKQLLLEFLDDAGFAATSWQEGAMAALVVEMVAEVDSRLSRVPEFLKKAFLSSTATGETLTRTSGAFYKNSRLAATSSKHLVTLSCLSTAGPHSIGLGDLVVTHPDGHSYRNVTGNSITYPATLASGGTLELMFEAEVAGAQTNIGNAITPSAVTLSLDTTLSGASIAAHSLFEAGVDEESDTRLDQRNTSKWATLAKVQGIDEAFENLALESSPGIIFASVDSTNPRGAGTFDVYISGLDATASDDEVAKCQAVMRRYTFGKDATVQTRKAPEVDVDLVGTVYYSGNFPAADIQAEVEAALLAFVQSVPLGGFRYTPGPSDVIPKNDLEAVMRKAVEDKTMRAATVTLSTPAADIAVVARGRAKRGDWTGVAYQAVT